MLAIKTSISFFTLLNVFIQIEALVELPIAEDHNIGAAETAIRNTVDKLFTIFRIKQEVNHKPRLKQYSTIHNFFVSITLTDCNNLREVARLSRVNKIDNNTKYFMTQINEVLNEDDKNNETNDTNNTHISKYISIFVRKLKYLKEVYQDNRNTVINSDILKYSDEGGKLLTNFSKVHNVSHVKLNDSDESEYWRKYTDTTSRIFMCKVRLMKVPSLQNGYIFFRSRQSSNFSRHTNNDKKVSIHSQHFVLQEISMRWVYYKERPGHHLCIMFAIVSFVLILL